MADITLEAAAERLYGLLPRDFVPERTALAASAADRETAARIRRLRKPATAAWVANLLARRRPDDIDRACALAAELREAQDDRDAARLTELNKQRRMLEAELVRSAIALAEGEGVAVGGGILADVERTVGAAARDASAAAALRTGRLLRPLEASGLDPVDLVDAVAGEAPSAPAASPRERDDLAERRARREAERAAQAAEKALKEAARATARAETAARSARERAELLRERVEGLEKELARVRAESDEADAEVEEAESALQDSAARERAAEKTARAAGVRSER